MIAASQATATYRCPGEVYDITKAVHLARMAAGFDRCAQCLYRDTTATGGASTPDADAPDSNHKVRPPGQRRSVFTDEGVRGVYRNELTRQRAGELAGAFASCLWDDAAPELAKQPVSEPPLIAESGDDSTLTASEITGTEITGEGIVLLPPGRPGPLVVLACDERPASPDLAMGVGLALRRMGCQVVDIGPATRPCFWFAVDHLHAAGGLQVTGAGCDPAWTGLDFVRQGVWPCSRGADLDRIQARYERGYGRASRRPGSHRLYSVTTAYEVGLWQHFHGLRPFEIVLACPNRLLRELLERLFRKSACQLTWVETPTRARSLGDPNDPDLLRVSKAVREQHAHLGIVIDDDAQSCRLFDDEGRATDLHAVLRLLDEQGRHSCGTQGSVAESAGSKGGSRLPTDRDERVELPTTLAAMSAALRRPGALCRVDNSGRYWFAGAFPVCDAVLTLVHLLQALSRQDTPFSELLGKRQPAA
ncbi:MAG: hypothetical protein EXS05_02210 [Planctomycetaceae bacterium]|nr:hypothetical protein [Planctomycetaceae bacterium]